jgi:hypothetical protein
LDFTTPMLHGIVPNSPQNNQYLEITDESLAVWNPDKLATYAKIVLSGNNTAVANLINHMFQARYAEFSPYELFSVHFRMILLCV